MKKLAISLGVILVFLLAVNVQAGELLGRNLDPGIARPDSNAFGKSLDEWMEAYLRWLEAGADPADKIRNVAFLPIICPDDPPPTPPEPCIFEVEVKPGTALVLPVATWLGFAVDDTLPDEWFGDRDHVFGDVTLDGEPIVQPNEDYYVGPTLLDPPVFLGVDIVLYQAIVFVIPPLSAGDHEIVLHAEFVDFGAVFDNIWNITVVPPGKR
jgi:hypothetical protein